MVKGTQTHWYKRNLRVAFGTENQQLHAHIARLTVLYEDLRLELIGAGEDNLKSMDGTTINYRKQYFMRRAIGTTVEFAEAFRLLDRSQEFEPIKQSIPQPHLNEWNDCVDFFAKHEPDLKEIRNDIGGHFGYPAALHAIQNLNPNADGTIRIRLNHRTRTGAIWYEFAEEIAATGMERRKPKIETSQAFFARLFSLLLECFNRAIRATDLVTNLYTLGRFT